MELNRVTYTYEYVCNLIEQGVIVDIDTVVPVMGGLTLLQIATFNNDQKLVDYLLHKKADVHSKSRYWGTALHTAVIMKYLPITESLINYGADVNARVLVDPYVTRFRYPVYENDEDIPEFLLKRDDDVNRTLILYELGFAKSPLQIAIDQSEEEMVELLLKSNADPNLVTTFLTPLNCAISEKNSLITKLLLAYGADVNSVSGFGFSIGSSLHFAVKCLNTEAVELILNDSMVDPNIVTVCENSALHYAIEFAIDDKIIRQLLNAGVDINLINSDGETAFTSNLNNSPKVHDAIIEHIAKLSAANIYINKQNLAIVNKEKFDELRNQCLSEIEKMKITYVCTSNVTFYNVLCNKCEHELAVSLKYVSDSDIFDLDIPSLFPLYGGMISYRLKKALGRKKMLFKAISLTNDIFDEIQLPSTFTRDIFKLLTNKDLKKLQ
ncbi:putative ankyrin repeat protein RF_0381 [Microplitis mediator]|uniref:putative ankyrin repeat protein RF_0381 n=1 Tax=Microplitis mediator TaxID=375433 RepID=UPI0025550BE7|nr:putative ankyrin repeat protein RF_0381 [Microplitis mediator]XP_057329127.1 putative ankyrin repeat protein RF_0381 [Microplitis mediator]